MIVLSGKRIRYGVLAVFVMFMVVAISLNPKEESKKYINTVSLPVSGKVVVIDARTW